MYCICYILGHVSFHISNFKFKGYSTIQKKLVFLIEVVLLLEMVVKHSPLKDQRR